MRLLRKRGVPRRGAPRLALFAVVVGCFALLAMTSVALEVTPRTFGKNASTGTVGNR